MKRAVVLVLVVLLGVAAEANANEIEVASQEQITPRLTEYRLKTPALADETIVRVLLPDGYDASAGKRYPVLYLLHGCCDFDVDGAQAWSTHGEVEQATAGTDLIVVMPASGKGGFYTDWYNNGQGGQPAYETFHIGQLVPWIDGNYRTRAAREGRAIAGLSMGGFGAISYASRHPDMFVAAATFSGAVNVAESSRAPLVDGLSALDGGAPGSVFGPRTSEGIRWRAHNPVDIAPNLEGLRLTIRTGNGEAGGPYGGGPDPVEESVHEQSVELHQRFDELRLPHVWDDYGPGAHSWPYWARDLRETLPQIMDAFATPPAVPKRVRHMAVEPSWSAYGWHVEMKRPVLEFSELTGATRAGFTLAGSGPAVVTTPPVYRPGKRFFVHGLAIRADRRGRLKIPVDLGPANRFQQDLPGTTTRVGKTVVRVRAAR